LKGRGGRKDGSKEYVAFNILKCDTGKKNQHPKPLSILGLEH